MLLFANRQLLQLTLPSGGVLVQTEWPFSSQSVRKTHFSVSFSNRVSYLRTVISYNLLYPRGECSCRFRSFPASVSISGPPEGRFRAKVFEKPIFRSDFLTGAPLCKSSVPKTYSTLVGSARAGVGVFPLPFPFPDPRMAVFEPKCLKNPFFSVIF